MASNPEMIAFASREAMAARVADLVEVTISSCRSTGEKGALAVSGGSTPRALYEDLAKRNLAWPQTRLTLVDERWVPADHPRSNEAFIRRAFSAADNVPITGLYNGAATPRDGAVDANKILGEYKSPFDAVVLGMGDDGHTASWFPHAEGLETALGGSEPVCAIRAEKSDVTGEEVDRITLTLSAIKDARIIILLIAGEAKRDAFERAREPGPVEEMPVRAIMRERPDMWVCWAP